MPDAGWYDDPESGLHIRYWDGTTWTAERRPKPPVQPTVPSPGAPTGVPLAGPIAGTTAPEASDRSFLTTLILAILVGFLGVHRFYVGKVGTGLLMLFTFGGFGIWQLIDIILIAVNSFTDRQGRPIRP